MKKIFLIRYESCNSKESSPIQKKKGAYMRVSDVIEEFITSYFAWLPLSVQKEKVEDLENIIDNNKRKNAKK